MKALRAKCFSSICALFFIAGNVFLVRPVLADIDAYVFDSPEQEVRYRSLIDELRCPKCQNANLMDSAAPLAKDLRRIAYDKIRAGESDDSIKAFMQERYGDFILYKPPVKPVTWILWFGPAILLLLVVFGVGRFLRRQQAKVSDPLSPEEQSRLNVILNEKNSK